MRMNCVKEIWMTRKGAYSMGGPYHLMQHEVILLTLTNFVFFFFFANNSKLKGFLHHS